MSGNSREILSEIQFRNKITCFSFALIMGVVYIHAFNLEVYGISRGSHGIEGVVYWLEMYMRELQNVCVPFFFLISGYLFFRTFSWKDIVRKYNSRIWSIGIPYLLWCSFYYLYFVCITNIPVLAEMIGVTEPVKLNIQTWILWLWKEEYYVFWFLKELIVLILCTPVIFLLFKNYKRIWLGLFLIVGIVLCKICIIPINMDHVNIYYIFGAYLGINHRQAPMINKKWLNIFSVIATIIVLIWRGFVVFNDKGTSDIFILAFCIILWFSGNYIKLEKKLPWWFELSFFIYCIHDFILEIFEKIFLIVAGDSEYLALIDYIFMPILVTIIAVFVAKFMKKYTRSTWNILTGNRG